MAEIRKCKANCPKCNAELEIEIREKLEMPYDADQKERVMNNTFFRTRCKECNTLLPTIHDCEYNDLEKKFLIWVIPKLFDGEKARIMEFNKRLETDKTLQLAQGGYRYRLVRSDNELREKVLIFDEGLDDRFIETMKMAYVPAIKKTVGEDCKILGLYFDKNINGNYQWVVLLEKKEPLVLNIDMKIYEDMKEKLWDIAEEKTMKGLALIEAHWALDVLNANSEESN